MLCGSQVSQNGCCTQNAHVRKKYVVLYFLVISISIFTHHFSICAVVIGYLAKTRHTHDISVNSHNQAMKQKFCEEIGNMIFFNCLKLDCGKRKTLYEMSKGIYVIAITRFLHCQIFRTEHILESIYVWPLLLL